MGGDDVSISLFCGQDKLLSADVAAFTNLERKRTVTVFFDNIATVPVHVGSNNTFGRLCEWLEMKRAVQY